MKHETAGPAHLTDHVDEFGPRHRNHIVRPDLDVLHLGRAAFIRTAKLNFCYAELPAGVIMGAGKRNASPFESPRDRHTVACVRPQSPRQREHLHQRLGPYRLVNSRPVHRSDHRNRADCRPFHTLTIT